MKTVHSALQILLLALVLVWCSTPSAKAQSIEPGPSLARLGKLQFEPDEALSSAAIGSVSAITQDHMGFLWFGTRQGLFRYDGDQLKSFDHTFEKPDALPHDSIWCFLIDRENRLWIGTQKGVSRFEESTETFTNYLTAESWPNANLSNRVNSMRLDSQGRVVASTEAGYIYRYEKAKDRFNQLNTVPIGLIKSMDIDDQDRLWIGIDDAVVRYLPDSHQTKVFSGVFNRDSDTIHNFINTVHYTSDTRIWAGTSTSGVAILDSTTGNVTFLPIENTGDRYVAEISESGEGLVWTIANGSLCVYDSDLTRLARLASDTFNGHIAFAGINTLFRDRQGNLWIGSNFDGVSVAIQGKSFHKVDLHTLNPTHQANAPVCSLMKDRQGNLWIADGRSGIDVYPSNGEKVVHYRHDPDNPNSLSALPVLKIFEDSLGEIWIGTYQGGLFRFRPETGDFESFLHDDADPKSISGQDIRDIVEDDKGNLWINTHGTGIDYFDRATRTFTHYRASSSDFNYSIIDDWAHCIYFDSKKQLWIGTDLGLSVLDTADGSIRSFQADVSNPRSISNSTVLDIIEDSKGRIWLATESGLNLYDSENDSFVSFSVETGFPHRSMHSIVEDRSGILWVGTYDGLARFDPETLYATSYDGGDGLACNEFFAGAAFIDEQGYVYFGQHQGVSRFDPESIENNTKLPPVYISGFKVFNESLPVEPGSTEPGTLPKSILSVDHIRLRPDQKVFTVEFVALNYIRPDENLYSYKLEGFDTTWSPPSKRRSVTYTNLNPGVYTFRVRASNDDGYWNETGDQLKIEVLPPFWGTPAFKIAAIVICVFAPIAAFLWRIHSIKEKKRNLEVAVDERTRDLKRAHRELEEAYNQIFRHGETLEATVKRRTEELQIAKTKAERSDRLKSAFLANISHEIRTPMNAILGFIHFLDKEDLDTRERRRFITLIRDSGESLVTLIDDIIDLATLEAGTAEISPTTANLQELTAELFTQFSETIENNPSKQGIELILENGGVPANGSPVSKFADIDSARLKQILANLLSNAVKFTEKGAIRFGYRIAAPTSPSDSPQIVFKVSDTGIGIPEEHRNEIFDHFHKLDRDDQKLSRGVGLGLTITKKLVELMRGSLSIESKPKQGTTILVSFPYHPAKAIEHVDVPARSTSRKVVGDAPNFREFSILVVEDERPTRDYLENILQETGVTIHWADTAEEARRLFQRNEVHLVILDLKLPDADGLDLTAYFRRSASKMPIIALSSFASSTDTVDALHAGATVHLCKPFRPEEIIETLRRHLDALQTP